MNSVLLSVGVAVVVALFAALLGPFVIDWNAYKHVLEARLSELAGEPVRVGEVAELRLLPTPVLKANGIRIEARGEEGGEPLLTAPHIEARIALAPILRGAIEIDELLIERPALQVQWRRDGSVAIPGLGVEASPIDPQRISLNTLEIREGSITVRDQRNREVATVSGFNLTGEASSLTGPFKAAGGLVADDVLYTYRLGTGRVQEDGSVRTKLAVQPASGEFELALDGQLSVSDGQPVFSGAARLQKLVAAAVEDVPAAYRDENSAIPWRATMEVEATPLAVKVDTLALGIGHDERAVQMTGSGDIKLYPELRIAANMQANQIDLDRALGHGPGGQAAVGELGQIADGLKAWIKALNVPLDLRLGAEAVLINGGLAENLELDARVEDEKVRVKAFSVRPPGRSVLSGSGTIALGEGAPSLDATTQLETRQAGQLIQWLGLEDLNFGALKVRPGAAAIVAKTRLGLRDGVLRLDDLEAHLDDSAIAGRVFYRTGKDAPRKLELALAVDEIDLDRYFEIAPEEAPEEGAQENGKAPLSTEVALRLNADRLSLGGVAARALVTDLVYSNGSLTVNSLSLGDLGGTSLAASGRIDDVFGQADGEMTATMTSEDLTGVARLAADFGFTGRDGADLVAQAAAVSPAAVEATLKATRSGGGTEVEAVFSGALAGTVARTEASFQGKLPEWRQGTLKVEAEASNPDGNELLAQLGLPASPETKVETLPGKVSLTLSGPPAKGAKLNAEAGFLGVSGKVDGTLTLGEETAFNGHVEADSPDARNLLRRLDAPGKDAPRPLSVEVAAKIDRKGPRWRLEEMDAKTGRETFNGDLELDLPQAGAPRLTGKLDFDTLSLPWLLATLVGAESGAESDAPWPEAPFDLASTWLLEGKLGVSANRLELPGGTQANGARFDLTLEPGSATFGNVRAGLYGGEATGSLRLAESVLERGVALTANLSLKGAAIEELAWAPNGTPVATGTLDVTTQINGSGRSWLGLVSSLGGEGSFTAHNGVLRGLDPDAFVEVVKAADAGLELEPARVMNVFQGYLAAGALPYDRFQGVFEVSDGIVSAKNVTLETEDASLIVSSLVDLHQLKLDSEWTLTPTARDTEEGEAAVPPVTLVFAGPVSRPHRQLDVDALTGYLTVRRLEEDVRRLEAAQADALERERFDRILMQQTHEHMRRAREKRERARIAAERAKRDEQTRENAEAMRREAASVQAERLEAERLERERLEAKRRDAERRQQERIEAQRLEAQRLERERKEAQRLETERLERERKEAARLEAERIERERLEAARREALRIQREGLEAARREAARIAREGRQAREREDVRRAAARHQAARLEVERITRERQSARAAAIAPVKAPEPAPPEREPAPQTPEAEKVPLEQLVREALRRSYGSEPPPNSSEPLILNSRTPPAGTGPDSGADSAPADEGDAVILTSPVLPPGAHGPQADLQPETGPAWPFDPTVEETPQSRAEPRSRTIDLPFDPINPGGS